MLSINYKDSRPIYEQVRDSIRRMILTGAIAPGEKLPSVRELAATLAINPNTIQRSYRELEHMGLIVTIAGKGAFASTDNTAAEKRKQELLEEIRDRVRELQKIGMSEEEIQTAVTELLRKEEAL